MPTVEVVAGFVGVLVGTVSTSTLTIYKERFTAKRERDARDAQIARETQQQRDGFQRESLLALQQAVTDLVTSVYDEQDRMLRSMQETGQWPARTWETITARGWSDAEQRLEMLSARVFDEKANELATRVHNAGRNSVWAPTIDEAKASNLILGSSVQEFHQRIRQLLPALYGD
jgi:hypothetical protein